MASAESHRLRLQLVMLDGFKFSDHLYCPHTVRAIAGPMAPMQ